MGWRYEVSAYIRNSQEEGFMYQTVYAGNSLFKSIVAMMAQKFHGTGCIKLEWRP